MNAVAEGWDARYVESAANLVRALARQ